MSTSKRYRLLVDLPDCPKYAIFERMEGSILYRSINPYTTRNNPYPMKSVYKNIYVENNPDFFELVEDKPENVNRLDMIRDPNKNEFEELKKRVDEMEKRWILTETNKKKSLADPIYSLSDMQKLWDDLLTQEYHPFTEGAIKKYPTFESYKSQVLDKK